MQSTRIIFKTFWHHRLTSVDTFKLTTILVNNNHNMENAIGNSK